MGFRKYIICLLTLAMACSGEQRRPELPPINGLDETLDGSDPNNKEAITDTEQNSNDQEAMGWLLTMLPIQGGEIQINPSSENLRFEDQTELVLTAIAAEGWEFVRWTGGLESLEESITHIVTADIDIGAEFAKIPFPVNLTITGNGNVALVETKEAYTVGDRLKITSLPDSGWVLDHIKITGKHRPQDLMAMGDEPQFLESVALASYPDADLLVELIEETTIEAYFRGAVDTYQNNFDSLAAGDDPVGWLDTQADLVLQEGDDFKIINLGGELVFGTQSNSNKLFSHYLSDQPFTAFNYEYSGKMQLTSTTGSIGVTVLSGFLANPYHYSFGSTNGSSFQLNAGGTDFTSGGHDTQVTPKVNKWYLFKVQTLVQGGITTVMAKVWEQGTVEPMDWLVTRQDASMTRLKRGTFGIWASGSGNKYWDNIQVSEVE